MVDILDIAKNTLEEYGKHTIMNRAIPDFRDGLKPVHRRILWSFYKLNMKSNGNFKKSALPVSETMGKYHPHGDLGIYNSLVTMVNLNTPLVQGQGNWGNFNESAAASRYTECRLTKYSEDYLLDKEYLECTTMVPNYNEELLEPLFLPAKIPNLIVNGSEGIATGCGNLIPSFNLDSVKELVVISLKQKITPEICKKVLKLEFKYGGYLDSEEVLLNYYKTGNASLIFKPSSHLNNNNKIVIDSYCYRFNINKLLNINNKNISNIDDLSSKGKVNIEVSLKRNLSAKELNVVKKQIESTLKFTLPCKTNYTLRFKNEIKFKSANIPELVNDWVKWRIKFEKKVLNNMIRKEREKLAKENLYLLAIKNKDLIIKSLDRNDPETFLEKKLQIDLESAKFILNQQIRRLAKLEKNKISANIKTIKSTINEYKNTDIKSRIESSL